MLTWAIGPCDGRFERGSGSFSSLSSSEVVCRKNGVVAVASLWLEVSSRNRSTDGGSSKCSSSLSRISVKPLRRVSSRPTSTSLAAVRLAPIWLVASGGLRASGRRASAVESRRRFRWLPLHELLIPCLGGIGLSSAERSSSDLAELRSPSSRSDVDSWRLLLPKCRRERCKA